MEEFLVKISASLLISVLLASDVVAARLTMESKISGKGSGIPGAHNSTLKEDCKQDVTGIRRAIQYVYNDPNLECYKQFFVNKEPPIGLRFHDDPDIRYICQPPKPHQRYQDTYYATMFDEDYGIAVYAAYSLTWANANFRGKQRPVHWCPTPGIMSQGSDDLYWDEWPYEKGHLAPAHTFSNKRKRYVSTFTYTNAVPQCQAFNGGRWKAAENKIRKYAIERCTRGLHPGILYILTGTSFVHYQHGKSPKIIQPPLRFSDDNPTIAIPSSMWTAGCCVFPHYHHRRTESFAVIGSNVQDEASQFIRGITVERLQSNLKADVTYLGIGGPHVNLFPGNPACANNPVPDLDFH